jgi:hypothetical protein
VARSAARPSEQILVGLLQHAERVQQDIFGAAGVRPGEVLVGPEPGQQIRRGGCRQDAFLDEVQPIVEEVRANGVDR